MDWFEQRSREIARAILERHGWKRPMSAEVKEMREITNKPLMECKRYLLEEWQDMCIPLLEKENEKLRELVQNVMPIVCDGCHERLCKMPKEEHPFITCWFADQMSELGIEVDV